jgi:hypothetical protein
MERPLTCQSTHSPMRQHHYMNPLFFLPDKIQVRSTIQITPFPRYVFADTRRISKPANATQFEKSHTPRLSLSGSHLEPLSFPASFNSLEMDVAGKTCQHIPPGRRGCRVVGVQDQICVWRNMAVEAPERCQPKVPTSSKTVQSSVPLSVGIVAAEKHCHQFSGLVHSILDKATHLVISRVAFSPTLISNTASSQPRGIKKKNTHKLLFSPGQRFRRSW